MQYLKIFTICDWNEYNENIFKLLRCCLCREQVGGMLNIFYLYRIVMIMWSRDFPCMCCILELVLWIWERSLWSVCDLFLHGLCWRCLFFLDYGENSIYGWKAWVFIPCIDNLVLIVTSDSKDEVKFSFMALWGRVASFANLSVVLLEIPTWERLFFWLSMSILRVGIWN